jgi:hypothetical protein
MKCFVVHYRNKEVINAFWAFIGEGSLTEIRFPVGIKIKAGDDITIAAQDGETEPQAGLEKVPK